MPASPEAAVNMLGSNMARVAKRVELKPPDPDESVWKAIEGEKKALIAVELWKKKMRQNSKILEGMGGEVIWSPLESFWGYFDAARMMPRRRRGGQYWNAFGLVPQNFRQNMIVEINPPIKGKNTNLQGVLAVDNAQNRWVLHGGRLHPPGFRIKGEQFDKVYGRPRVVVRFGDGSTFRYHPVANIDGPPQQLQAQMAEYVRQCARIRLYYTDGAPAANTAEKIEDAERGLKPETEGEFILGPRDSIKVQRRHGTIWKALVKVLKSLNVAHSNKRIGRYGPDLKTFGEKPTLFEIKTSASASAIYEGYGQLHIYEKLLQAKHIKVLALPELPHRGILDVLTALKIEIIVFKYKSRAVSFDQKAVSKLVTKDIPL